MKISLILVATCLLIANCKRKEIRKYEALEVGAIKDVKAFGAKFIPEEIQLGVVKICRYNSRVRCFSGALVSKAGHIITTGHSFHEILGGEMYKGEGHPRQSFVSNIYKVFPGFHGSDASPIIPPEFDFDVLGFHRTGGSLDFALIKILDSQLTDFQKWAFPLEVDLTYVKKDIDFERVFVAGYTWPHLSLKDLGAATP